MLRRMMEGLKFRDTQLLGQRSFAAMARRDGFRSIYYVYVVPKVRFIFGVRTERTCGRVRRMRHLYNVRL
jgi:hypothetical protein